MKEFDEVIVKGTDWKPLLERWEKELKTKDIMFEILVNVENCIKSYLSKKVEKFDVSQQDYNNPSQNHENMMTFYAKFADFLEDTGMDKLAGLPPKLLASYLYDQALLVSTLRKHVNQ